MKLYIKDLHSNIRYWSIIQVEDNIYIEYGRINGNCTQDTIVLSETPNGYKTRDDYVKSVIASRVNSMRRKGYKSLDDLNITSESQLYDALTFDLQDKDGALKPMLCSKYNDKKLPTIVGVQPKFNGIRCTIRYEQTNQLDLFTDQTSYEVVIRSKQGIKYIIPHIANVFYKILEENPTLIFDGELYIHNRPLNYIKSCVPYETSKGNISEASNPTEELCFYNYELAIPKLCLIDRETIRTDIAIENNFLDFKLGETPTGSIVFVKNEFVNTKENSERLDTLYYTSLKFHYEGTVQKDIGSYYLYGRRTNDWMKRKPTYTTECKVLDIRPKDLEPETALFILLNDINDEIFECNPIGTYEERKEYLDNKHKYIGKQATVDYKERSGVKQVPFHSNVITIRDYE